MLQLPLILVFVERLAQVHLLHDGQGCVLGCYVPFEVIRPPEDPVAQFALNVWFFVGLHVSDQLVFVLVTEWALGAGQGTRGVVELTVPGQGLVGAEGQVALVAPVDAFFPGLVGHGVGVEVGADFEQLPALLARDRGLEVGVLPQRVRVHGHFGAKAEATLGADEVLGIRVDQVVGVEFTPHL